MVHTLFPGTRTDRGGWALVGVSSGGYCAAWTTIMRSDVFGNAGDMSGYNVPIIGGSLIFGRFHFLIHIIYCQRADFFV